MSFWLSLRVNTFSKFFKGKEKTAKNFLKAKKKQQSKFFFGTACNALSIIHLYFYIFFIYLYLYKLYKFYIFYIFIYIFYILIYIFHLYFSIFLESYKNVWKYYGRVTNLRVKYS